MEGIVRVFVLLAQVSSSLWRKNGLSIVNQVLFYLFSIKKKKKKKKKKNSNL